ncbi:MAG: hypothetical protein JWQ58_1240 [Reyranella sp.]|nr:hypothetical protein [Reyranella sp.]
MAVTGGAMSVWAWTTPDTHIGFRLALPLLTAWLLFTMVRLALTLPAALKGDDEVRVPDPLSALVVAPRNPADAYVRKASPDAMFVRQVSLPREPELRRRRRVAQRVELRDGRALYRVRPVQPAPVARRVMVGAGVMVASVSLFFLLGPLDLEDVSWLASLFHALEELPGLFQPVEAIGFLPALGLGAGRDQHRL